MRTGEERRGESEPEAQATAKENLFGFSGSASQPPSCAAAPPPTNLIFLGEFVVVYNIVPVPDNRNQPLERYAPLSVVEHNWIGR